MLHRIAIFAGLASFAALTGCVHAPSALAPGRSGSVGLPSRGVLTAGAQLPETGEGYSWLRHDERHYGITRLVNTIERASKYVAEERPGAHLRVGDLALAHGGTLMPHLSHRSGRDVDLLLYMQTLTGEPVASPGFIRVEADGLAYDKKSKNFYRFDIERQWLLIRYLLTDPDARVQWIFIHRNLRSLVLEWAVARGESGTLLARAAEAMAQPQPGGLHDDHIHVRIACSDEDVARGCEPSGPRRSWIRYRSTNVQADAELALELFRP